MSGWCSSWRRFAIRRGERRLASWSQLALRERQESFRRYEIRIDRFHFTVIPLVAAAPQARLAMNVDHVAEDPAHARRLDLLHQVRIHLVVDDLRRKDDEQLTPLFKNAVVTKQIADERNIGHDR